jgi:hypothetical protein
MWNYVRQETQGTTLNMGGQKPEALHMANVCPRLEKYGLKSAERNTHQHNFRTFLQHLLMIKATCKLPQLHSPVSWGIIRH